MQGKEAEIKQLQARLERLRVQLALASVRLGEPTALTLPSALAGLGTPVLSGDSAACRRLAKQRATWAGQRSRVEVELAKAQRVLAEHQRQAVSLRQELEALGRYLAQLEADNATNPNPPVCILRVDAGFASGPNVAWLIELGYQVYTKPLSDQTTASLRKRITSETVLERVGANAELIAWDDYQLHDCPYPVRVALERFQTGETVKYATLLLYRDDGHVPSLAEWFGCYNGRQTIEAGNKESKTVFKSLP